eukprot:366566-Chlamydomonas_euryale.AAC.22
MDLSLTSTQPSHNPIHATPLERHRHVLFPEPQAHAMRTSYDAANLVARLPPRAPYASFKPAPCNAPGAGPPGADRRTRGGGACRRSAHAQFPCMASGRRAWRQRRRRRRRQPRLSQPGEVTAAGMAAYGTRAGSSPGF